MSSPIESFRELFPKRVGITLAVLVAIHQVQQSYPKLFFGEQAIVGSRPLGRDDEEADAIFIREETKTRYEKLEQLASRECETGDDIEALLEALRDYTGARTALDRTRKDVWESQLVEQGYTVAAKGVETLLIQGNAAGEAKQEGSENQLFQIKDLSDVLGGPVEQLRKQLDGCPSRTFRRKIQAIFEPLASKAIQSIQRRRAEQALKALIILKRAIPASPILAIASVLSIYLGSLNAARLYMRGEILTRAIAFASGSKEDTTQKGKITVTSLIVLEVLVPIVEVLAQTTQRIGKRQFTQKLQVDLFAALLGQDTEFFEKNETWNIRYLIGNVDGVCGQLINTPLWCMEWATLIASSATILFRQSPQLAGFMFLVALPGKSLLDALIEQLNTWLETRSATTLFNSSRLVEIWNPLQDIKGVKALKAFAREPIEVERYASLNRAKEQKDSAISMIHNTTTPFRDALDKFVEVFGVWYGSRLVARNQMRAADLPSFVSLCSDTFDKANYLRESLNRFGEDVLDPIEKMHDLLMSKPRVDLHVPSYDAHPDLTFSIELRDVHFAYPTRPQAEILRGVSFAIKRGERIGIMGESGCGKSTIFALLERFYEPSSGQVLIGGIPIENINPLYLRERIAYVPQQSYMAKETILDNLLYGRRREENNTSREEQGVREKQTIERALALSQCSFFLTDKERFPDGLMTNIGKNASKLSGGEVQRLALARALLCEPAPCMYLLDEYTSALDETSQKKVQEAIDGIWEASNRTITILSIAHRLSNFKNVDRVIAMSKDGRVAEIGPPKELLLRYPKGIFATFLKTSEVDFSDHDSSTMLSGEEDYLTSASRSKTF